MVVTDVPKKVLVVYNKKTNKLIPFSKNDVTGEIIITTTGYVGEEDDIIVSMIDALRLDLFNGYILPEGVLSVEE